MEQSGQDLRNYVDLNIKQAKLNMVEKAAILSSRAAAMFIVLLTTMLAILAFAVAGGVFLYGMVHSTLWAAILVGVYFLLWALFFFAVRKKLFSGVMVRVFSKIFFEDNSDKLDDEQRSK